MQSKFYNPVVPPHVPPELVYDFDIYNLGPEEEDLLWTFKRLQDGGIPDLFWTRHNGGHWIAARAKTNAEILRDYENFGNARPTVPDEINPKGLKLLPFQADPPEHTVYRALISATFAPKRIAELEAGIRAYAVELIEGLAPRGECEFVSDFADKMPIIVFMRLVDLPEEHRHGLVRLVYNVIHAVDQPFDQKMQEITDYLTPVIRERRSNPGDDLISALTKARIQGRPLSETELHGICGLLLLGGLDTVASTLGLITRFLAESPTHRHQLVANRDIIPNAVEELLRRFPTVVGGTGRLVRKDVVYNGIQLRKDEHVMAPMGLYNFDERVFDDPMTVNFSRPKPVHASFGPPSPHRCPGSYLARTEIKIFLEEWLPRIPDFKIKPGVRVRMHGGGNLAYRELPLVWDPQR